MNDYKPILVESNNRYKRYEWKVYNMLSMEQHLLLLTPYLHTLINDHNELWIQLRTPINQVNLSRSEKLCTMITYSYSEQIRSNVKTSEIVCRLNKSLTNKFDEKKDVTTIELHFLFKDVITFVITFMKHRRY